MLAPIELARSVLPQTQRRVAVVYIVPTLDLLRGGIRLSGILVASYSASASFAQCAA